MFSVFAEQKTKQEEHETKMKQGVAITGRNTTGPPRAAP